jgi:hypothetical protein
MIVMPAVFFRGAGTTARRRTKTTACSQIKQPGVHHQDTRTQRRTKTTARRIIRPRRHGDHGGSVDSYDVTTTRRRTQTMAWRPPARTRRPQRTNRQLFLAGLARGSWPGSLSPRRRARHGRPDFLRFARDIMSPLPGVLAPFVAKSGPARETDPVANRMPVQGGRQKIHKEGNPSPSLRTMFQGDDGSSSVPGGGRAPQPVFRQRVTAVDPGPRPGAGRPGGGRIASGPRLRPSAGTA